MPSVHAAAAAAAATAFARRRSSFPARAGSERRRGPRQRHVRCVAVGRSGAGLGWSGPDAPPDSSRCGAVRKGSARPWPRTVPCCPNAHRSSPNDEAGSAEKKFHDARRGLQTDRENDGDGTDRAIVARFRCVATVLPAPAARLFPARRRRCPNRPSCFKTRAVVVDPVVGPVAASDLLLYSPPSSALSSLLSCPLSSLRSFSFSSTASCAPFRPPAWHLSAAPATAARAARWPRRPRAPCGRRLRRPSLVRVSQPRVRASPSAGTFRPSIPWAWPTPRP